MKNVKSQNAVNVATATGQELPTQPKLDLLPAFLMDSRAKSLLLDSIQSDDAEGNDTSVPPSRAFIQNVRQYGILTPIIVTEITSARTDTTFKPAYRIIDGRRRVAAARVAGFYKIAAMVIDNVSGSEELVSLLANEQRSANLKSDFLHIRALETKYAADGVTEADVAAAISKATGMSKATINSRLGLKALQPFLLDAMLTERIASDAPEAVDGYVGVRFPMQAAVEAAKLDEQLQEELACLLRVSKRLSVQDVRDIRRKAAAQAVGELPGDMFEDDYHSGVPALSQREANLLAAVMNCLKIDARNAKKNGKNVQDVPHLQAVADALAAYEDAEDTQNDTDTEGADLLSVASLAQAVRLAAAAGTEWGETE